MSSWPDDNELKSLVREYSGILADVARHLGRSRTSLYSHLDRVDLLEYVDEVRDNTSTSENQLVFGLVDRLESLHKAVSKRIPPTVEELADQFDCPPKVIRSDLQELRDQGYRISDPDSRGGVALHKVAPSKINVHKSLLDGNKIKFGLISDTHLSSNEQALEHLELAYDKFEDEGITEVYHAGDWTAGVQIFPQQHSAIFNHTFESQLSYLVENHPRRKGIITRGITGNHDIEGGFGRIGANPVAALANRRDDIEFLGDYSAYVELPGGQYLHLLHGKGSMSYAYSYKAQKITEGYPAGRKPAIVAVGHWHVHGLLESRNVQVIFPGCFEWQSPFMERLGLQPAVGFHIIEATIGDDGSIVEYLPRWHKFYEGRSVN